MTNECSQFIDSLIAMREERGMTQQQLAKASNIAQPSIARLESKRTSPTLETIVKITNALDCKIEIISN